MRLVNLARQLKYRTSASAAAIGGARSLAVTLTTATASHWKDAAKRPKRSPTSFQLEASFHFVMPGPPMPEPFGIRFKFEGTFQYEMGCNPAHHCK
jgi:hypothetical protein